jgi:hypothetical protein
MTTLSIANMLKAAALGKSPGSPVPNPHNGIEEKANGEEESCKESEAQGSQKD